MKVGCSINYFNFLSDFVPYKFSPKYELLNIYVQSNEKDSVKFMGNVILTMREKIPSMQTKEIKYKTREILEGINTY